MTIDRRSSGYFDFLECICYPMMYPAPVQVFLPAVQGVVLSRPGIDRLLLRVSQYRQ